MVYMAQGDDTFHALSRDLRNYLAVYTKVKRSHANMIPDHPFRYVAPEELVLFNAVPVNCRITDTHLPAMRLGNCFGNAFEIALTDDAMRYHEGWAYMEGSIPTHHAWLVDADGAVHDPTWLSMRERHQSKFVEDRNEMRCVYMGVHIPIVAHMMWYLTHGTMNLLADGEMTRPEVLINGMDAFAPFNPGPDVLISNIAQTRDMILNQIRSAGEWTCDDATGIFTHTDGRRWCGKTRRFLRREQ
jgi:hypothetical protein